MDDKGQEGVVGRLRHNYLLSPITALSFYRDASGRVFVLAAEDTWLKVFDVATNQLLSQLNIFHSQPIHGIYASEADATSSDESASVLLWGGQSVAVLSHAAVQSLIDGRRPPSPPAELRAADWIYDGILFPSPQASGVLVTAHNEIIPLSTDCTSFGPLVSPSRPILYSANLRLLPPGDSILVAGGTVFGEIIVWKYHLASARWDLLFVFTGHEGSIFGVAISPELEIAPGGVKARLLASCSDDRTIRVWDITERHADVGGELQQPGTLGDARETGFGANSEVRAAHEGDSARCVAVAMGHVSRIWHVKFSGRVDCAEGGVEVFSFGEDGSRQRWELDVGLSTISAEVRGALVGTLTNCGISTAHSGKNIWAAAVAVGDSSSLVVSGGADGKIAISGDVKVGGRLYGIEGQLSDGESSSVSDIDTTFSLEEVTELIHGKPELDLAALPKKPAKKATKDGFLRYAFISETTVLATSVSGRLFLGTATESVTWEEIATTEDTRADLSSYNVVKSPARDTAVLGGASGKMYLYRRSHGLADLAHFPGKITDIICLGGAQGVHQPPDAKIPETLAALVTVLGVNHATMLKYSLSTGESCQDPRTIQFDDDYQNYAMTAASLCDSTKLVVGSRVGLLTLYSATPAAFTPLVSRKDSPSKDSITCILPLPHTSPTAPSFLTTSRDGRYRIYTILPTTPTPTLHLHHEISPPLAILEGAWFTPDTSDLILYGFRGKNFFAWNETTRSPLATLECGGAHRPFAYVSAGGGAAGALRLVFTTKGANLRFVAQPRAPLRALQQGGHGREIRAVAACGRYVATAAEDTTVRVWEYLGEGGGFRCLAVLERHTAGIQSLAWCGEGRLVSTAGNEEMFVWRVTRLGTGAGVGVVCEGVFGDRSEGGDLRIVGLDLSGEGEGMVVSVGLSDSEVRSYWYGGGEGGGFRLRAKGRYTGACLTQVRHLRVEEEAVWVLTVATDGFVGVWVARRGAGEFELVVVERLHQSSIKSLDIAASGEEGGWLVVTGGDDNALGFLELVWSGEGFTVASKSRVKSAHAAAVTGLRVVRARGGVTEVATVSNDQRLKVWRARRKAGGGIAVTMLENRYSSVADPGDVEVIAPGRLMVGGVGMEVWEV